MPYCVKCGSKLDDDAEFCPHCGQRVPHEVSDETSQGDVQDIPAMKVTALSCPHCGGEIHIPRDADSCTCPFCGTQVMLDRGNRTVTYRIVDEAKIRQSEVDAQRVENEKHKTGKWDAIETIGIGLAAALIIAVSSCS